MAKAIEPRFVGQKLDFFSKLDGPSTVFLEEKPIFPAQKWKSILHFAAFLEDFWMKFKAFYTSMNMVIQGMENQD